MAIQTEHDVAGFEAGSIRGAPRLDRADHHRTVLLEPGGPLPPRRDRGLLGGNADEGAARAAVPYQLAEHETRGVGGDREANALRAHDYRGVDTDHLAA